MGDSKRESNQTPSPAVSRSSLRYSIPLSWKYTLASLKAGAPGAAAAAAQSASFMWISTTTVFQFRNGTSMLEAFRVLYGQGGIPRFYSGIIPTVVHVSVVRFGDTSANFIALNYTPFTSIPMQTAVGSAIASAWRVLYLPLETVRANLQARGLDAGRRALRIRMANTGWRGFYMGSAASLAASYLGHYPFFLTVNLVSNAVPLTEEAPMRQRFMRNGGMGFIASMFSDVVSNGFKVVATHKQTSKKPISYYDTAKSIITRDGVVSLLTRGLKTRLLGNAIQCATFVLLWKEIEARFAAARTIVPPE